MLLTSHHPQTDGQSEVAIQLLTIGLRAYVASNRASWAKYLPELAFAYNSIPLPSVLQSPFFLLHGYHPRSPATTLDSQTRGIPRLFHNADANDFVREITAVRQSARDAFALAQSKQAEYFNKGRREEEFEEGDEVLVDPHALELVDVQGTGRKLVQRRIGPFLVSEKINDTVYRVELPAEYQMHPVINQEHLTKYRRRDPELGGAILPEMRPIAREEVYEVKRIIGHKNMGRRGILYRVRWKGFGPGEDTYKPEINLRNAFSKLREYKLRKTSSLPTTN